MSLNQNSSFASEEYELRANGSQLLEVCQRFDRMTAAVETSKGQIGTEKLLKYQNKCARFNKIILVEDESTSTINYVKLAPFTHLKELYVHLCPPSVFDDLYAFRGQLEVIELSNSGITDLMRVFQPPLAVVAAKNPSLLSGYSESTGQGYAKSSSGAGVTSESSKNRGSASTSSPSPFAATLAPYLGTSTSSSATSSTAATALSSSSSASYEELFSTLTPMVLDAAPVNIWIRENYNWSQLRRLSLCNCGLARLDESMHFFSRLESLNLSRNDISHITHLQDCSYLFSLDLSYNRIKVLSNVSLVLGNIKQLFLANNQIQSLDGLDKLFSLQELDVSHNLIEDVTEVCHIRKLPCLENICLRGNPMSRYQSHTLYRLSVYQQLIVGKDAGNDLQQSTRSVPDVDGESMSKEETLAFSAHLYKAPVDQQRDLLRGDDSVYVFPFADSDVIDIYADDFDADGDDDDDNEGDDGNTKDQEFGTDRFNNESTTPASSSKKRRSAKKTVSPKAGLSPLMNDEQAYTAAALMDQFTGTVTANDGKRSKRSSQAKSLMRRQAEESAGKRPSQRQSNGANGMASTPRSAAFARDDASHSPSVGSTITDASRGNVHANGAKISHIPVYFSPGNKDSMSGAIGRCSCGELIFRFKSSKRGAGDQSARQSSVSGFSSSRKTFVDTTRLSINSSSTSTSQTSTQDHIPVPPRRAVIHTSETLDFVPPSMSAVTLTDDELNSYLASLRILPSHVNTAEEYIEEFGRLDPPAPVTDNGYSDFGFPSFNDMTPIAASKSSSFFSDTPDRHSPYTPFDASAGTTPISGTSHPKSAKSVKSAKGDSQDDAKLPKKNLRSLLAKSSASSQSERHVGQGQTPGQESPTSLLESFKKESKKNKKLTDSNGRKDAVGASKLSPISPDISSSGSTSGSSGWRATATNSVRRVFLSEVVEETNEGDDGDSEGGFDIAGADRSFSVDADVDRDGDEIEDENDEETAIEKYAGDVDLDTSRISTTSLWEEPAPNASVIPRPRAKTRDIAPNPTSKPSDSDKQSGEPSSIHNLFQLLSLGPDATKSKSSKSSKSSRSLFGKSTTSADATSSKDSDTPPPPPAVRPKTPPGGGLRVSGSVFGDTFPGPSSVSSTSSASASASASATAAAAAIRTRSRTVSDASHTRGSVGKRPSVPRPIEYIGKKQYHHLNVVENFGLYFAEQVFSPLRSESEGPFVLRPGLESKAAKLAQRPRAVSPAVPGSTTTPSAVLSLPSTYFVSPPPREEHFFAAFTVTALDLSFELLELLKVQDDAKLDVQYELAGDFKEDNPSHSRFVSSSSQPSSQPSSLASSKNPSPTSPNPSMSPLSRLKNISSRLVSGKADESAATQPGASNSVDVDGANGPTANKNSGSADATSLITDPRLRKHPISAQQGLEESVQELDFIFALTDAALYVFRKDCLPAGSTFRDAPVPVLYRCHPMHHLRELLIFFGLQRSLIQFSPTQAELSGDIDEWRTELYSRYPDGAPRGNASNASTGGADPMDLRFSYAYAIVTRDKSQMHPIIEHFSNAYTLARQMFSSQTGVLMAANLAIRSKDVDLLNQLRIQLTGTKAICEIMHYQMLYQTWRKRKGVAVPRTIVLTPTHALLFYEELQSQEVKLTLLDKASYKNVVEVRIESGSPGLLTLVLRASPLITKTRKWRLYLNNHGALSRLYDAVKSCCADAKNPI